MNIEMKVSHDDNDDDEEIPLGNRFHFLPERFFKEPFQLKEGGGIEDGKLYFSSYLNAYINPVRIAPEF